VVVGSKQMLVFEDSRPDNKLCSSDKCMNGKMGDGSGKAAWDPIDFRPMNLATRVQALHRLHVTGAEPLTPGEEEVRVLPGATGMPALTAMNGEPVQVNARNSQKV